MIRRLLACVGLGLFGVILSPSSARACTCMAGIPLCESAFTSDVVFTGEVLSVESFTNPNGERFTPHRRVRIRVIESWRGNVSGVVEVTTGGGGGDCGYTFLSKMTYLVYAYARDGALSTGICSRTRPLSQAAEDVAYLKTAMKPSLAGRIFGTVQYQPQWDPNGGRTPDRLIAGYLVTLSDGQRLWKAVSDAAGRFEFTVPAGTYTIALQTPQTESGHGPRRVTLADSRGCAAANFYVTGRPPNHEPRPRTTNYESRVNAPFAPATR